VETLQCFSLAPGRCGLNTLSSRDIFSAGTEDPEAIILAQDLLCSAFMMDPSLKYLITTST
jgi:hypothetical protein